MVLVVGLSNGETEKEKSFEEIRVSGQEDNTGGFADIKVTGFKEQKRGKGERLGFPLNRKRCTWLWDHVKGGG